MSIQEQAPVYLTDGLDSEPTTTARAGQNNEDYMLAKPGADGPLARPGKLPDVIKATELTYEQHMRAIDDVRRYLDEPFAIAEELGPLDETVDVKTRNVRQLVDTRTFLEHITRINEGVEAGKGEANHLARGAAIGASVLTTVVETAANLTVANTASALELTDRADVARDSYTEYVEEQNKLAALMSDHSADDKKIQTRIHQIEVALKSIGENIEGADTRRSELHAELRTLLANRDNMVTTYDNRRNELRYLAGLPADHSDREALKLSDAERKKFIDEPYEQNPAAYSYQKYEVGSALELNAASETMTNMRGSYIESLHQKEAEIRTSIDDLSQFIEDKVEKRAALTGPLYEARAQAEKVGRNLRDVAVQYQKFARESGAALDEVAHVANQMESLAHVDELTVVEAVIVALLQVRNQLADGGKVLFGTVDIATLVKDPVMRERVMQSLLNHMHGDEPDAQAAATPDVQVTNRPALASAVQGRTQKRSITLDGQH